MWGFGVNIWVGQGKGVEGQVSLIVPMPLNAMHGLVSASTAGVSRVMAHEVLIRGLKAMDV